jgi:integrase
MPLIQGGIRMEHLPFCVFRRRGREFYYVKFKDKTTGKYVSAVSTKQETKAAAIATAYEWLKNGMPMAEGGNVAISVMEALRQIQTTGEADFVCRELRRRGLLKIYVITGSKPDVDFPEYLQNFWDYETSSYIKEKLRQNHGIHKNYTFGQRLVVEKYWMPFFKKRLLGSITREDIENFIDDLAGLKLSAGRKNSILKAGTIPLKWAFSKEIIEKDIVVGITWFSGDVKERHILTPEIVTAIFKVEWNDERARLANLLAAVTGLRSGEIRGLRVQDLGEDCLYIRHSYNLRDKLKTTKNNESRRVEIPFPFLIEELLKLARLNPHGASAESYIFWANRSASKPIDSLWFIRGLREALIKIGMDESSAGIYMFHGWRHYFTSYMKGRLDKKLLKSQTGHKTDFMLDHYGDHLLAGDREKIRQAQQEVFGALIPQSQLKKIILKIS